MVIKTALYGRISTTDQKLGAQVHALEQYCKSRALDVIDRYFDSGFSGSASSRPQLDRLMSDARRHKFDAVVVYRFDRFARSTNHLLSALNEFRSLKISFISISEAIDTTTPLGEALFTIVGAIGQLERDIIRERVRAGLSAAVARGVKLGRPRRRDDKAILQLRGRGLSIRQIAKELKVSKGAIQRSLAVPKTRSNQEAELK